MFMQRPSCFDLGLASVAWCCRFRELYLAAEKGAEENREREWNAAVTIQSAWRGYLERKHLGHLHSSAVVIQRAFRGLMGRKAFRMMVKQELKDLRTQHYNQMATRIQSRWRGFAQRKNGLDFYARKLYLETLRAHNAVIQQELQEFEREQAAKREAELQKQAKKKRLRDMERKHVLLSTRAVRTK